MRILAASSTLTAPAVIACAGCGARPFPDDPYPFRCPNARPGDDIDHLLTVSLDPSRLRFPDGTEPNPFIRYRTLSHAYHLARRHGRSDAAYVDLVGRLDDAVRRVDGRGFEVTASGRSAPASEALGFAAEGGVWIKDETGNVSGSHKARHLMGLLIHLQIVEELGLLPRIAPRPELAIASCGNAALAAAVVARAGDRPLRVFIPPDADPAVLRRLRDLGAALEVCPREPGTSGDPTYLRLRQAVREGALPFTCQGSDNGLTIEGGKTLGWEMAAALRDQGVLLDRLFVQVGGGALASACIQGLQDAAALGILPRLPRIHAVQTERLHPLYRAYALVAERIARRIAQAAGTSPAPPGGTEERADLMCAAANASIAAGELAYAVTHRSEFMWPWEGTPGSVAHGILDDETYDWAAVVSGMVRTGGYPVLVSEAMLGEANTLAREATAINVDPTGSAGLAGLMEARRRGKVRAGERVGVLFTGVQR